MKPIVLSAICALSLTFLAQDVIASDSFPASRPVGYRLVWSDEFDNPESLESDWRFEVGGKGWGNNELQYYCANGYFEPTAQRTAEVKDGSLFIIAHKIDPGIYSDNRQYISARMNTARAWQYGYFEMRAKLPAVAGSWPAFWMLPADGKYDIANGGGELDIMEWVANEPDDVWFSAHCREVTRGAAGMYENPTTGEKSPHSLNAKISDPADEYHTFAMEWTHEYVRALFDGVEYYRAYNPVPNVTDENRWPFDKEYYVKLNLAVGGSWGGDVDPDFSTATYEIDYVRVYQKE